LTRFFSSFCIIPFIRRDSSLFFNISSPSRKVFSSRLFFLLRLNLIHFLKTPPHVVSWSAPRKILVRSVTYWKVPSILPVSRSLSESSPTQLPVSQFFRVLFFLKIPPSSMDLLPLSDLPAPPLPSFIFVVLIGLGRAYSFLVFNYLCRSVHHNSRRSSFLFSEFSRCFSPCDKPPDHLLPPLTTALPLFLLDGRVRNFFLLPCRLYFRVTLFSPPSLFFLSPSYLSNLAPPPRGFIRVTVLFFPSVTHLLVSFLSSFVSPSSS